MADYEVSGAYPSKILVNSEGINEVNTCQRCKNYEVIRNETLGELNSIQMINKLLLKELQLRTVLTNTWVSNPDATNKSNPVNCKEWTVVTKRNHKDMLNKQEIREKSVTERRTRNRFTPLAEISTDAEDDRDTIPVMVNGVISVKGSVKITNKPMSQKNPTIQGGPNLKMTSAKIKVNANQQYQQRPNNSLEEKKQKIIIIGDSHTRGSASNIKHNLSDEFDIKVFVKPGADITKLTFAITEETKHLTFKDILLFWGGANDVGRNNSREGLKKLIKFVEVNSNTNIILLCVHHRHDLPGWSCVNNKIVTFNRKLNNSRQQ